LSEFPGLRQAQLESFAVTDAFAKAWSAADYRITEEERRHRLGLVIDLDGDDDAGPSTWPRGRRGDAGQGCNSYLPQPKEEDPEDGDDYATAMYRPLGLGRGNGGGSS
jgi:hypothetical protein